MEPKIVTIDEFNVVGVCSEFDQQTRSNIPNLWMQFAPRMSEVHNAVGAATYGVCFPGAGDDGRFNYMAAIAVSEVADVPDGMEARVVPAQKYAVFTHVIGDANLHNDLQGTLQYIWGSWLPDSKYAHAPAPDFELYDGRFDPMNNTGEIDIYVPIT